MNIHEAKTNFSKLVEAALAGEEVIIAKSGAPILKLMKLEDGNLKLRKGYGAGRKFFEGITDADVDELVRIVDEPVEWKYRELDLDLK